MKKKLLIPLIAMLMVLSFSIGTIAATKYGFYFNGKKQAVDVQVINNKAYVPLASVTSLFGGKVSYDAKTKTYKITSKDYSTAPKSQSYNVNVYESTGPMSITIKKVTLDSAYKENQYSNSIKAIVLDVEIKNNSMSTVNWYPDQGTFATNTGEQTDDAILYSDDLGGTFLKNTVKKGRLALPFKDFNNVNSIEALITGPVDEDTWDRLGEDLSFTITFR